MDGRSSSHSRSLHSKNLVSVLFKNCGHFPLLHYLADEIELEINLLISSWSHTPFSTLFLKSVPLSLNMAILLPLWASILDK